MSAYNPAKIRLIYIGGATNSGSSLLDLLLGNHPKITGCGEMHRLMLNPDSRLCSCGETLAVCPLWSDIILGYEEAVGESGPRAWDKFPLNCAKNKKAVRHLPSFGELALVAGKRHLVRLLSFISPELGCYLETARNSWILNDVIGQRTGTECIVDSTKTTVRFKSLYLTRPDAVFLIHLIRDGRAVAASLQRRFSFSITEGAARWKRQNKNVALMAKTIPEAKVLQVHYENLCDDPEGELKRICEFINVEYVETMPLMGIRLPHSIPGNPMLFHPGEQISKDERWKADLSKVDLQAFESVAGDLLEEFGYPRTS